MEKIREKIVVTNWIATTALAGIMIGVATLFWKQIPPQIPVLYSKPWGEMQLGSQWWLIVLAGCVASIGGLNFLATKKISDMVLVGMIGISLLIVQLILALGTLRILMLVV